MAAWASECLLHKASQKGVALAERGVQVGGPLGWGRRCRGAARGFHRPGIHPASA